MLPGGNSDVFQETVIVEAAQAQQTLVALKKDINEVTVAFRQMKAAGTDMAEMRQMLSGQGVSDITMGNVTVSAKEAVAALDQVMGAAQQAGGVLQTTMEQDVMQIKRATAALREMSQTQRTTPLSASMSPQYQQLGFQPATTTAAMTELGAAFDKTAGKKDSFRLNLSQLYAKFKEGTLSVNDFSSVLLGAFGAAVGFMVVSAVFQAVAAVGQFINSLNQAAVASLKFMDAQFKLEVGLRDAQRQGFQVSRIELNKYIADLNAAYPMLSTIKITEGIAESIFILKNFGLTSAQAFKTFDAAAALAVATGKDMGTVTREIALAASSGYSVALQKMGLDINRATVAQEAHKNGVDLAYMALTREQKVLYTLNLVASQTAGIMSDLAEKQNTLAGKAEAVAAAQETATISLGKNWEPFKLFFDQLGLSVATSLANILYDINVFSAYIEIQFKILGKMFAEPFIFLDPEKFDAAVKEITASVGKAHGLISAFQGDLASQKSGDALAAALGIDPADIQNVYDSMDKFAGTVLDDTLAYQKQLKDATQKYNDDLVKIDADGEKKRVDLKNKLVKDLADIDTKLSENLGKAQIDFTRAEDDANRKAAEDRVNSLIDEKRKEEDIQQKYVDSVRKLNDKLTQDLEEAVRAGDVIQIRKLKRQYPADLAELGVTRDQDITGARKDLQQKLSDAERQRAFDRQQRAIDFQQKVVDLNAQAVVQRQQTNDQYVQSLADLNQSLADERKARVDSYNQQWRDMYKAYQDKLKLAAEALADEVKMNNEAMNMIAQKLISIYGAGGIFQQVFDGLKGYIESGGQAGLWTGLTAPVPPTTGVSGVTGAGSFNGTNYYDPNLVKVSVDLGPDLQGKIVNASLNVMADLLTRNV